ncbi:MAG: NUDIX domain-containing protein [Anaerolineae bacterium]|nr:NUDIX domain-containing protein [Anaerolineae bacterium]
MSRLRRFGYRCLRLWWGLRRPVTVGVRVVLIRDEHVLLVKHTYQDAWYVPGGGVQRGETLVQAARREAKEEVGATLGTLWLLGVYTNLYEGKSDHVAVFVCTDYTLSGRTDGEIERFAFYALDALPAGTSPGTRRRLEEFAAGGGVHVGEW